MGLGFLSFDGLAQEGQLSPYLEGFFKSCPCKYINSKIFVDPNPTHKEGSDIFLSGVQCECHDINFDFKVVCRPNLKVLDCISDQTITKVQLEKFQSKMNDGTPLNSESR